MPQTRGGPFRFAPEDSAIAETLELVGALVEVGRNAAGGSRATAQQHRGGEAGQAEGGEPAQRAGRASGGRHGGRRLGRRAEPTAKGGPAQEGSGGFLVTLSFSTACCPRPLPARAFFPTTPGRCARRAGADPLLLRTDFFRFLAYHRPLSAHPPLLPCASPSSSRS